MLLLNKYKHIKYLYLLSKMEEGLEQKDDGMKI